jgi:hypothetical protein
MRSHEKTDGRRFLGRDLAAWIDYETILDSWLDLHWQRLITLYGLAEPLSGQGYVAVCYTKQTGLARNVVFLRTGGEFRSLDPGTEVAQLRRYARAARRRSRTSSAATS